MVDYEMLDSRIECLLFFYCPWLGCQSVIVCKNKLFPGAPALAPCLIKVGGMRKPILTAISEEEVLFAICVTKQKNLPLKVTGVDAIHLHY